MVKILVVNSSPDFTSALEQSYLNEQSCQFYFYDTGTQAQDYIASHSIDLVLCNIDCGDMPAQTFINSIVAHVSSKSVLVFAQAPTLTDALPFFRLNVFDFIKDPLENIEESLVLIKDAIQLNCSTTDDVELFKTNQVLKKNLSELTENLQAGRYVQKKLMPISPKKIGDFHLSYYIRPSSYLSGDFINYTRVGERYITFWMADVSGHGASSAFITVLLKNITARYRRDWIKKRDQTILLPSQLLSKINEELIALDSGKHATMFVGVVDMEMKHLTYSHAGHHPFPILSTPDSQCFLEEKSKPVGLFANYTFQDCYLLLPDVFKLIIFSDGILEILDDCGIEEKQQRLLKSCQYEQCNDIGDFVQYYDLARESEFPDDIAIFLLKCEL
jgi:phosphoserine phosphatase RsbU/P